MRKSAVFIRKAPPPVSSAEPTQPQESQKPPWDPKISARIRNEIGGLLGKVPEEVKESQKLVEDLGFDELDSVEMLMAAEEMFGIAIPDEDFEKIATVGDLIRYVESRINSERAEAVTGTPAEP